MSINEYLGAINLNKIKMNKILLLLLLPFYTFSQDKATSKINGVDVTYEYILKTENEKTDKYVLNITYSNNTDKDLYYASIKKGSENKNYFGSVIVQNTKGIFSGTGATLVGEKTKLQLASGENIYLLKKGKTYNYNGGFTIEKEKKPIISFLSNELSFESLEELAK